MLCRYYIVVISPPERVDICLSDGQYPSLTLVLFILGMNQMWGLVVGEGVWVFTELGHSHLPSHWEMTRAHMHVKEIAWGGLTKEGHETQGGEQTES